MYTKITHGWVETIYGDDGFAVSQRFVAMESTAVERKLIATDGIPSEDDDAPLEEILSPEQIKNIEQTERHCDMDMVQPVPRRSEK